MFLSNGFQFKMDRSGICALFKNFALSLKYGSHSEQHRRLSVGGRTWHLFYLHSFSCSNRPCSLGYGLFSIVLLLTT